MSTLNQIFVITLMNLRNIPARKASSMVIVVGIAGVVTVLIAILSMAQGFEATLRGAGQADRAIVIRAGSDSEMGSSVPVDAARQIETMPGLARIDGNPLVAGETYVIADIKKRANDSDANMPMRGVEPESFEIRNELKIVQGRNFQFGRFELIAGVKAANQFQGIDLGSQLEIRGAKWQVVGLFESEGSIHESEVWVDNAVLVAELNRGWGYSSMIARLESPLDLEVFGNAMEKNPQLETKAVRESSYYNEQSTGITSLITDFGYSVAAIMGIGAIFGALNTMYSAVSTRSVEIATLRALGFSPIPVVISVLVESILLALLGGSLGSAIAYLFFNGYTASTMGATFSQVSFDFAVTRELIVQGITWSCLLGLVGGLFPSVAAARQPITVALRGL